MHNDLEPMVPVVLQFYDWFRSGGWVESEFVDPIDFDAIGVSGDDRSSIEFYTKNFQYIRQIGVDAISWQFNIDHDGSYNSPSSEVVEALYMSGLMICPFIDLEMIYKIINNDIEQLNATLNVTQYIQPNDHTIKILCEAISAFYKNIPKQLIAKDKKGREIIFVFGYGFDRANDKRDAWKYFGDSLIKKISRILDNPCFYWTCVNSPFLEYLFLHYRNNFCSFHFVLDTPQAQYSHDCVTWNFGFDNYGVAIRDNLERVIRNDLRYYKEMGWLACATDPSVIFIYSWNEPFEGSMLVPTKFWGDAKSQMAKSFIKKLKNKDCIALPKTLVIINDICFSDEDWHMKILREIILYPLRRLAPQSEIALVSEALMMDLSCYSCIIDFSIYKEERLSQKLISLPDTSTVMFVCPFAMQHSSILCNGFTDGELKYVNIEDNVKISDGEMFYCRDDVLFYKPSNHCEVIHCVKYNKVNTPLLSRTRNMIWLNAFTDNNHVLSLGFSALYGRPMGRSILYGYGYESQIVRIKRDGEKSFNRFSMESVNMYFQIPKNINIIRYIHGFTDEENRFIFHLDDC